MSNDLLALAAATCWAIGSMLSVTPSRHLGAIAFTRWRMFMVAIVLWITTLSFSGWQSITTTQLATMALSGFIGIFIGDTANFSAMNMLGPRRSGILFSTNALISAVLGFSLFDERMNLQATLGAIMTISGVMIAVMYGRRKTEDHAWELNHGHHGLGILLGLTAALCHSVSTIIAKPIMTGNFDPILASAIRVSASCGGHLVLLGMGVKSARALKPVTPGILGQTALSGIFGMAIGMSLLLLALHLGDVGMVAILSSVTPILLLPLLWIFLRRPPAKGAWIGAILSVTGTALILAR